MFMFFFFLIFTNKLLRNLPFFFFCSIVDVCNIFGTPIPQLFITKMEVRTDLIWKSCIVSFTLTVHPGTIRLSKESLNRRIIGSLCSSPGWSSFLKLFLIVWANCFHFSWSICDIISKHLTTLLLGLTSKRFLPPCDGFYLL